MSTVFKALADPTRRQVLQLLRQGPKSAGELAEHFPVSKPTMSAHFAVLREAGLVDSDKQGRAIVYRLKMSVLEEALMEFSELLGLNLAQRAGRPSRPRDPSKGINQMILKRMTFAVALAVLILGTAAGLKYAQSLDLDRPRSRQADDAGDDRADAGRVFQPDAEGCRPAGGHRRWRWRDPNRR